MTSVLLDTHAWSLAGDARLSLTARTAIADADTVMISPITFFEIAQEVRLVKRPGMSSLIDQLLNRLHQQGGVVADFGPLICIEAGIVLHRDPFDRLIAATARRGSLPLVSADPVFGGIVPSV